MRALGLRVVHAGADRDGRLAGRRRWRSMRSCCGLGAAVDRRQFGTLLQRLADEPAGVAGRRRRSLQALGGLDGRAAPAGRAGGRDRRSPTRPGRALRSAAAPDGRAALRCATRRSAAAGRRRRGCGRRRATGRRWPARPRARCTVSRAVTSAQKARATSSRRSSRADSRSAPLAVASAWAARSSASVRPDGVDRPLQLEPRRDSCPGCRDRSRAAGRRAAARRTRSTWLVRV